MPAKDRFLLEMFRLLRSNCVVVTIVFVLSGCYARTTLTTAQPASALHVKTQPPIASTPASLKLRDTSFGGYEIKVERQGAEPFYGVLPLRLNGGQLAVDVLFFAPALFFNLRGAFPEYEIDMDKSEIRYRVKTSQPWVAYQPTAEEQARAKRFFHDQ